MTREARIVATAVVLGFHILLPLVLLAWQAVRS